MTKIFYGVLLFSLLFLKIQAIDPLQKELAPQSTLQQLAMLNMQTFSWKEPWKESSSFEDFIKNTLNDIINPSAQRKRKLAFEFFENIEQAKDTEQSCLLDAQATWKELNLFKGHEDLSHYLATIIDRTQSELGRISLFQLLANPISDLNILTQRQAVIKTMIADGNLLDKLSTLLGSLEQSEKVVLAWWDKDQLKQTSRHCYFETFFGKPLNEHALALDGLSIYDRGWRLFAGSKSGIASIVLVTYGLLQLANISSNELSKQANHLKPKGFLFKKLWDFDHHLIHGITSIIAGIICGSCSFEFFKKFRTHFLLENCLHTLMGHVAQVIDVMQTFKTILDQNPAFSSFQEFKDLLSFFDTLEHQAPALQEFIDLLSSDELHAQPSIFSLHGNTLRAYHLVEQVKQLLVPALASVGKLDAFVSLAKLCQEFATHRVQFSLVDFIDDQKPHLELIDSWYPLIDAQAVVPHSLALGGTAVHRNAVITGPNHGGKSTLLKEVVFALIMAQSVGIAPASSMRLTPFSTIVTSLNAYGTTPTKQLEKVLAQAPNRNNTSFHFFAFDQAFNNASPREGEILAHELACKLNTQKNCMSMMSTYFARVTQLAEKSKRFTTLQLPAHIGPDGNTQFSYQLEPGISIQDIAVITVPQA